MKANKRLLQPRNRRLGGDRLKLNLPLQSQGKSGRTLNISKTGLRYLVPRRVDPNETQTVSVRFQNGNVDCVVKPAWVQNLGVSSIVGARIINAEGLADIGQRLDEIVSATETFFAT